MLSSLILLTLNTVPGVIALIKYDVFPNDLNEFLDEHDGIIIAHYNWWLRFPIYGAGIEKLVNELNGKRAFKIYHCLNASSVRDVVQNPNTKNLWIFAHGAIDGIGLNDGILYYQNLYTAPRKGFIAQLHCNHCTNDLKCGLSLVDKISDYGCVPEGRRPVYSSRSDTECCISHYKMLLRKGKIT